MMAAGRMSFVSRGTRSSMASLKINLGRPVKVISRMMENMRNGPMPVPLLYGAEGSLDSVRAPSNEVNLRR